MASLRAYVVALAAVASASGWSPAAAGPAMSGGLPLTAVGALWSVEVDAGPAAPRWRFLVDTGASRTVLDPRAARDAGLAVAAGSRLVTPAGPVEAGSALLPVLRLGDRVRTALTVVVADLSGLGAAPGLDGILGMDALDADHMVLDFDRGRLLFPDAGEAARLAAGTAVPVREVGGRLVVEARVNGAVRALVLDSGADVAVVYDGTPGGATALATAGGPGRGRMTTALVALARLPLGMLRAVRVAPPPAGTGADGVLPAARFAWIHVDRPAGVVRLVPRLLPPGRG